VFCCIHRQGLLLSVSCCCTWVSVGSSYALHSPPSILFGFKIQRLKGLTALIIPDLWATGSHSWQRNPFHRRLVFALPEVSYISFLVLILTLQVPNLAQVWRL
jgi:hypothetical protein